MAKSKQPGHNNASSQDKLPETKQEPVIDGSQPLTSLQEKFTDNILEGMFQGDAYKRAGYKVKSAKVAYEAASRLARNVKIIARIEYKRAQMAEKADITREKQSVKLDAVAAKCLANGEHSTYVRAIEAQNRLYGLDKQVIQTEQSDEQRQLSALEAQAAADHAEFALWKARRDAKRARGADSAGQEDIVVPGANEFSTAGSDNGDIEPITGVDQGDNA